VKASGAAIQEILGSRFFFTSAVSCANRLSPALAFVPVRALSYKGFPGWALR
jgi:hypothetical protein